MPHREDIGCTVDVMLVLMTCAYHPLIGSFKHKIQMIKNVKAFSCKLLKQVVELSAFPFVTANTILSILAAEYPVEKLSCYLSDDGGALLTFEALAEATSFARIWVPFCRKHNIEPCNHDSYFNIK